MNFKLLLLLLVTICLVAIAEETSPNTQTQHYNQSITVYHGTNNYNRLEKFLKNASQLGNNARAIYFRYVNPWNDTLQDLGLKLRIKYLSGVKLDRPHDQGFGLYISSDRLP